MRGFWQTLLHFMIIQVLITMYACMYGCRHTQTGGLRFAYKGIGCRAVCVKTDCPESNKGCSEIPDAPKVRWNFASSSFYLSKALRLFPTVHHISFGNL